MPKPCATKPICVSLPKPSQKKGQPDCFNSIVDSLTTDPTPSLQPSTCIASNQNIVVDSQYCPTYSTNPFLSDVIVGDFNVNQAEVNNNECVQLTNVRAYDIVLENNGKEYQVLSTVNPVARSPYYNNPFHPNFEDSDPPAVYQQTLCSLNDKPELPVLDINSNELSFTKPMITSSVNNLTDSFTSLTM